MDLYAQIYNFNFYIKQITNHVNRRRLQTNRGIRYL